MKYINFFENFQDNELKEEIELYIVNLIDKGFEVECTIDYNKTYDYIDITIRPPYDNTKPYDEQEFFYWKDIKDDIIVLSNVLNKDYHLREIILFLDSSVPFYIDNEDLGYLEDLDTKFGKNGAVELKENTIDRIELFLIKNK